MIELLLTQLDDPVIRENFLRIKTLLNDIEQRVGDSGDSDTIINNVLAASVWRKISANVAPSTTSPVDQIPFTDFKSAKYVFSVRDETNNKTSTFEINITNQNGSLNDTLSAKISGGINFSVNVIPDSGNMKINLINNEPVVLSVIMARLTL